jgi:membrane fusion protein (multidrug efflux system)
MSEVALKQRSVAAATPLRRRLRGRLLRSVLMLGGIIVVAVGALATWLISGGSVSTDNAYVRAAKLSVATDVSGIVEQVAVKDGERVKKGQVLFRLDPRQFQFALDGAKANLAQVAEQMQAAKHDYQRMLFDIEAKQAQLRSDEANYRRYANLVQKGGVTRVEYDNARFQRDIDRAMVSSLQAQAEVQLARLGGKADIDVRQTPEYLKALAAVDEAERELNHTVVRAPFDAIATEVNHLQPGQYLGASVAAFGLISTHDIWIEADPKETELTHVKTGDPVRFTVDTYPGRVWHGTVESIAPNSASEFSILPAQNASGNWVKVVQRIPVRIHIDFTPGDPELRAGMSVEVTILTGHVRHLSDLLP